jgi:RNA polymerase sigma factor (sigma-70 family)
MVDLSDTEGKPAMTWLRVIRAGGHEPPKDPICQLAYDIARRAGRDHADAEDTASEVRPIVRRHARAHPGFPATPEDLRKFVLKVVVNLIRDQWKLDVGRRNLEGQVKYELESEPSVFYDPEQDADALIAEDERAEAEEERQMADVNREIASMSPERRLILFMQKWLDMSYAEIATVMDMTPGSVGQNLSESLRGIRKALGVQKAKKDQREKKA